MEKQVQMLKWKTLLRSLSVPVQRELKSIMLHIGLEMGLETVIVDYLLDWMQIRIANLVRTVSSSADEDMESSSFMPHNTHSKRTENNASSIVGNGSCNNKRIDTGLDAKKNYHCGMLKKLV